MTALSGTPIQVRDFKANILMVEDVQSEVILTRISLDNANVPYGLTILKKGSEVIPYLNNPLKPKPTLLLLDMMLPDMDGFEILTKLAESTSARNIPIAVLSGRADLDDLRTRYSLNIVAILKKPLDATQMRTILLQLKPQS